MDLLLCRCRLCVGAKEIGYGNTLVALKVSATVASRAANAAGTASTANMYGVEFFCTKNGGCWREVQKVREVSGIFSTVVLLCEDAKDSGSAASKN